MLIFPKKTKYKKYHKQKRRFKLNLLESKYNFPKNFYYGLKIKNKFRCYSYHLEMMRLYIKKKIDKKKTRRIIFGFFPDLPVTKKSTGLRMGKGKGSIFEWTSILYDGRILFELPRSLNEIKVKNIINKLDKKISVFCKFIKKKKVNL